MAESIFNKSFSDGLRPDVTLPVDQWAEENVILSTSNANEPGRYRASRTPYMIQVMRDLSIQSPITKVVLMMGAQLSKTQVILNCLGSYIDKSPGPILFVEPTDAIAKKVSNQRLGQMIQDCKALNKKVNEEKTKDQTNTMMAKTFPGGVLFMTGANSAAALRAMPIRFLAMDEIDAYPADVEGEGSPISLAEKRTTTFSRRKIISTSTPTVKGLSLIHI
jgi:phage terminase large subunit GpA-like protein